VRGWIGNKVPLSADKSREGRSPQSPLSDASHLISDTSHLFDLERYLDELSAALYSDEADKKKALEALDVDEEIGRLPSLAILSALLSDAPKALIAACLPPKGSVIPLRWGSLKASGMGWWAPLAELRQLATRLSGEGVVLLKRFPNDNEITDEVCCILAASGKRAVLKTVYRSVNTKIASFFGRDFSDESNKAAAAKNAFKLLSTHRYMLSIVFFLLSERLLDR